MSTIRAVKVEYSRSPVCHRISKTAVDCPKLLICICLPYTLAKLHLTYQVEYRTSQTDIPLHSMSEMSAIIEHMEISVPSLLYLGSVVKFFFNYNKISGTTLDFYSDADFFSIILKINEITHLKKLTQGLEQCCYNGSSLVNSLVLHCKKKKQNRKCIHISRHIHWGS